MDRYLDGQSFLNNIPNFRASEHPSIPDFPYETENPRVACQLYGRYLQTVGGLPELACCKQDFGGSNLELLGIEHPEPQ